MSYFGNAPYNSFVGGAVSMLSSWLIAMVIFSIWAVYMHFSIFGFNIKIFSNTLLHTLTNYNEIKMLIMVAFPISMLFMLVGTMKYGLNSFIKYHTLMIFMFIIHRIKNPDKIMRYSSLLNFTTFTGGGLFLSTATS
jgi:hypothetical protein